MSKYFVKPKSKIFFILILAIFLLVGFGVFTVSDSAEAETTCETSKNTNEPLCTCETSKNTNEPLCNSGFKLNVGIPGITDSCTYEVTKGVKYEKDEVTRKDVPVPDKETKTLYCISSFKAYVTAIYNLFIGVVGILAVIMIMLGGFRWLLAAGNAQRIGGAKTMIISAVIGMVLALASYSILNFINPDIWKLKLEPAGVTLSGGATVGLCNKNMNPMLFGDCDNGPKCGQKYMLMEQTPGGEDQYCSGFVADDDEICYKNKDGSTQITRALRLEDSPAGAQTFNAEKWYFNLRPYLKCGKLYKTEFEDGKMIYQIGTVCPINEGDKNSEESCIIKDLNISISSENVSFPERRHIKTTSIIGQVDGARCVKYDKDDKPESCTKKE